MNICKSFLALLGVAALSIALPVGAQTARPGDRAVEDLIEQVQKSEQVFARALDKDVKKSTIRGATAEVDVENYLKDFETSIERLEERFDGKYSASAELTAVMRQAGGIEKFIQSQPPSLKGRSEWDDFKASLQALAAAYGSVFPVDESKPPRRMNDLEIQEAATSAIDHGSKLRKTMSDAFTKEEKAAKQAAEADIDAMQKAAKSLKSRVDDGKPASGEAGVFADSVKKVQSSLGSRTLSADAKTASEGISAALAKVQQAFNMSAAPAAAATKAAEPATTTPAAAAPASTAPASTAPATTAPATTAPATTAPATTAPATTPATAPPTTTP